MVYMLLLDEQAVPSRASTPVTRRTSPHVHTTNARLPYRTQQSQPTRVVQVITALLHR